MQKPTINRWLLFLSGLLYIQAAAIFCFAVYEAFQPARVSVAFAWFSIGFLVLLALVLMLLARALHRSKRWARSPIVTIEVFTVLTGVWLWQEQVYIGAVCCIVTAVPILVLMFTKDVISATTPEQS